MLFMDSTVYEFTSDTAQHKCNWITGKQQSNKTNKHQYNQSIAGVDIPNTPCKPNDSADYGCTYSEL